MNRTIGTVVRGVRAPIFREGDDVVSGVAETVLTALRENGIEPRDKDVVAVTESVVARCQGNYATTEQIAADVRAKTGGDVVGVTFPILSRNRFSLLLAGIAAGVKKLVLVLSYPSTGAVSRSSRPSTTFAPAALSRRLLRARVWMSQQMTVSV